MELLFATLGGAVLGLILGYAVPGRGSLGALVVPAIGASTSAAIWAALTWVGWKFNGGWIWVVSLILSALIAVFIGVLLSRHRRRGDAELLAGLSRA